MPFPYKIGFIGSGNMAQALIKGLVETKVVQPTQIYATNRSPGKLQKLHEQYGIKTLDSNEALVETCDVVILSMKPQDLVAAVAPIASAFLPQQIVISVAAGIDLRTLEKKLPEPRLARVMPNTPTIVRRGVFGYVTSEDDQGLETVLTDLFTPMGYVIRVEDEDALEAITVSCASGTGFVFELMSYWQDWIEERGFEPAEAKRLAIETFLGAAMLAADAKDQSIEDLLHKVASKKGTTSAGLDSMRELEVERALRYSFEKAALRNKELAKASSNS